jgi:hypothetical protein
MARAFVNALLMVGCGLSSCTPKPAPAGGRPDTLSSDKLRASIRQQIGTPTCSSPAVCRALPLGAKPCGGPQQYLIYSLTVTDSARLAADAARYNQAQAQKNRDEGLVSDCSMLMAPRVSCVSGECAAVSSQARQPQ